MITDSQSKILNFLREYKSATYKQLLFFTKANPQDVKYLVNNKYIEVDRESSILYLKVYRKADVRATIALDILREILPEVNECKYSKDYPIILTVITKNNESCDIAVVKSFEQEMFFKKINDISKSKKVIVVIEDENYNKRKIKTKKQVLICKYPIEAIDKIN